LRARRAMFRAEAIYRATVMAIVEWYCRWPAQHAKEHRLRIIHARRVRARKVKTLLKADVKTDDTCHSEPRKRSSLRSQTSQSNPSRTLLTEKQHPKSCPGTPEKHKSHIFTESVPKREI
jgi:hypothetical protein